MTDLESLKAQISDEADLCRNEGATDIAALLDDTRYAIETQAREIERLKALGDELAGALRSAKGILENSGAESGYCMCGDPVASHSIESGHAPVDSHLYAVGQASECYAAALAAWEKKDG